MYSLGKKTVNAIEGFLAKTRLVKKADFSGNV